MSHNQRALCVLNSSYVGLSVTVDPIECCQNIPFSPKIPLFCRSSKLNKFIQELLKSNVCNKKGYKELKTNHNWIPIKSVMVNSYNRIVCSHPK